MDTPKILVIGGANIDFVGLPERPLVWHDKNPGVIQTSLGGVGRNIAENIAKLGLTIQLISLVGDDAYGTHLIEKTAESGVDISLMQQLSGQRSSVYLSIMDANDDMALAMSDMAIIDLLTPDIVTQYDTHIKTADAVVLDTNLPQETLKFLLTSYPQVGFFVDTVSVSKTEKIHDLLPYIYLLKPNRMEAEYLSGIPISTRDDAKRACSKLLEAGISHVVMSLGSDGCIYGNAQAGICHAAPLTTSVVNAAGAGDAMMAALVYGMTHKLEASDMLEFANAAAALTLQSAETINPNFSTHSINQLRAQNA